MLGIAFDFTAEPVVAPTRPPEETVRVRAVRPERDALVIRFPRVTGYCVEPPNNHLEADFDENHALELDWSCDGITAAIVEGEGGDGVVKAVLNPCNPVGTTADVDFYTSKTFRHRTDPRRSHVNWAVLDSSWEGEFCRVVESHPQVLAYVKNHNLGFTVPYRQGMENRTYVPDFIVALDDGRGPGDPLNLIV